VQQIGHATDLIARRVWCRGQRTSSCSGGWYALCRGLVSLPKLQKVRWPSVLYA